MNTIVEARIARAYALPSVQIANPRNNQRQHRAHVDAYQAWLYERREGAKAALRLGRLLRRVRWHLMPPRTHSSDTLYGWVGFYDTCCTFSYSVGAGQRPSAFKVRVTRNHVTTVN